MPKARYRRKRQNYHRAQRPISQNRLKTLKDLQDEEQEAKRLLDVARDRRQKQEDALIGAVRGKADITLGEFKGIKKKISRRVPHYKEETRNLAQKAGYDPDQYVEDCRNRGSVVEYWRFFVRTGHEKKTD